MDKLPAFHYVGPGDWTQNVRLGGKHSYLLSHLAAKISSLGIFSWLGGLLLFFLLIYSAKDQTQDPACARQALDHRTNPTALLEFLFFNEAVRIQREFLKSSLNLLPKKYQQSHMPVEVLFSDNVLHTPLRASMVVP